MNKQQNDSMLEFKDHRDFFMEYFKIRTEFVKLLSSLEFNKDKKAFTELYKILYALIDWTSNYVFNENIDKNTKILYNKVINFNPASVKEARDIVLLFRETFKLINKDHEKAEILPKKMINEISEEDKFYREEETQPLKYAKKAFTDLILKRF